MPKPVKNKLNTNFTPSNFTPAIPSNFRPTSRGGGGGKTEDAPLVPINVQEREKDVAQLMAQGVPQKRARNIVNSRQFIERQAVRQDIAAEQARQERLSSTLQAQSQQAAASPEAQAQIDAITAQAGKGAELMDVVSGGAAGLGTGAALGALGGPLAPVTVPVGAALGAVSGVITKVSLNKRQDVKVANENYKLAKVNVGNIINRLNFDPTYSPEEAMQDWNDQLAIMRGVERALTIQSQSDISSFIDAEEELARVTNFLTAQNIQFYEQRLNQAMLTPNPNAALLDLSELEIEK